ncbi:MAG: hypothetical protein HKM98_09855 [Gammaproteobacteria bacterium]|nr:hypothetical protein [Gammaproteobacteria bacterium]
MPELSKPALQRVALLLLAFCSTQASSGVLDDVGFSRLQAELGEKMPRTADIVIAQVESSLAVDHDKDETTPAIASWMPDPGNRNLRRHDIVDMSAAPAGIYSGHATAIARRMIGRGRDQGMVQDIQQLQAFSVGHWMGRGFLNAGSRLKPNPGQVRLVNHSWASNSHDSRILRRADWVIDQSEVIQVIGVRNAAGKQNHALFAALNNAIVVGRSDGLHSIGAPAIDRVYPAGRSRPHLVAPLSTGSAAAPTVASAAILLLAAAADPSLSFRSTLAGNRPTLEIYDAGRSEVIRAVLMAGADRETDNSTHGNIKAYRADAENRSTNGLDKRFGAGQLNVYHSWQILQAGEQEGQPGLCGFDYEPGLKGQFRKSYDLPAVSGSSMIAATLSWNLLFPATERFDSSAILNNLNLEFYEVDEAGARMIRDSASASDNTETIYQRLDPDKRYKLVVVSADTLMKTQDFAIAWRMFAAAE